MKKLIISWIYVLCTLKRTLNDGRNYLREVEDDNNGRSCVFAEDLGQVIKYMLLLDPSFVK